LKPKAQTIKENIGKLELIKIETFCIPKDTINRENNKHTVWEKIFASHTSDKGLSEIL
jgi:hypothetical protein